MSPEKRLQQMAALYQNLKINPSRLSGKFRITGQYGLHVDAEKDPNDWVVFEVASGDFISWKDTPGAVSRIVEGFVDDWRKLSGSSEKDPVENLKVGGFEFEETQKPAEEPNTEERAKLEREEDELEPDVLENGEIEKPEPQKWNAGGAKALAKKSTDSNVLPVAEKMRALQISELTTQDIISYLCPNANEKEAIMFLRLCQARGLNPFLNEAYLIKYGSNDPAQMVVGKEAFTRRAELSQAVDGFEAGIIVRTENGSMERRTGTFMLPEETLLGGWAKVYRNDKRVPYSHEIALAEYIGRKRDGTVTKFWREKPATMIRKVALVQVLREALPSEFSGMYDAAEVNIQDAQFVEVL